MSLVELRLEGNVGVLGLPRALGKLASLKILTADNTGLSGVPGEVLRGCGALHTLSVRGCQSIDIENLRATPGYEDFETRRQAGKRN